jgi:hypothetical protein
MPLAYLMHCKSHHDKYQFMLKGNIPCPLARAVICPYHITRRPTYYYQSIAKFYQSEITTYLRSPCFQLLVVVLLAVFIISTIISRPRT